MLKKIGEEVTYLSSKSKALVKGVIQNVDPNAHQYTYLVKKHENGSLVWIRKDQVHDNLTETKFILTPKGVLVDNGQTIEHIKFTDRLVKCQFPEEVIRHFINFHKSQEALCS